MVTCHNIADLMMVLVQTLKMSVAGLLCWGATSMLETKYVGDNFEMLVTVLADCVTFFQCNQHLKVITNINRPQHRASF